MTLSANQLEVLENAIRRDNPAGASTEAAVKAISDHITAVIKATSPDALLAREFLKRFETPKPVLPSGCVGRWDFTGLDSEATSITNQATTHNNQLENYITGAGKAGNGVSEPMVADCQTTSGTVTDTTMQISTFGRMVKAVHLAANSSITRTYTIPATAHALSFYITRDAGGTPTYNTDVTVTYNGSAITTGTVTAVTVVGSDGYGTNCFRISCTITQGTADSKTIVIACPTGKTPFKLSCFQLNTGALAAYDVSPHMDLTLTGGTIGASGVTFSGTAERADSEGAWLSTAGPVGSPYLYLNNTDVSSNWTIIFASTLLSSDTGKSICRVYGIDAVNANCGATTIIGGNVTAVTVGGSTPATYFSPTIGKPYLGVLECNPDSASGGAAVYKVNETSVANASSTDQRGYFAFAANPGLSSGACNMIMHFALIFERKLTNDEIRQGEAWMQNYLNPKGIDLTNSTPPVDYSLETDATLYPTPPMGWESWNFYGRAPTAVGLKAQADAIRSSGLLAKGYELFQGDAFILKTRDSFGNPVADETNFPLGFEDYITYVIAQGFVPGAYTTTGITLKDDRGTSFGSSGYEAQDATYFSGLGVKYVKFDAVSGASINSDYYTANGNIWGLYSSGRASKEACLKFLTTCRSVDPTIAVSLCLGAEPTWNHTIGGVSTRHNLDSAATWAVMAPIMFDPITTESTSSGTKWTARIQYHGHGTGFYYDLDALTIGLSGWLTATESYSQMSLYCLLAMPLMLSHDVANQSATTLAIVGNADAISIDQDPLCWMGFLVKREGTAGEFREVWAKPLVGGKVAVGFFNKGGSSHDIACTWTEISDAAAAINAAYTTLDYPDCVISGTVAIKDVWAGTTANASSLATVSVASHACKLYIVG